MSSTRKCCWKNIPKPGLKNNFMKYTSTRGSGPTFSVIPPQQIPALPSLSEGAWRKQRKPSCQCERGHKHDPCGNSLIQHTGELGMLYGTGWSPPASRS
jgi:hypothetical protein